MEKFNNLFVPELGTSTRYRMNRYCHDISADFICSNIKCEECIFDSTRHQNTEAFEEWEKIKILKGKEFK